MQTAPANLLTEWSRLWVESLVSAGVTCFVVCPGSRNTPLVAAIETCARSSQGQVRVFHNIDERAAAFFALGQAKLLGRPSAVVCTSGSAAAHFFPSLVEAERSRTPLLLITADRPPELQANSAAQTLDQLHLFGSQVRGFFDVGVADAADMSLRALRRKAVQAAALTQAPLPGPVHVNFPARKPLEPQPAVTREEQELKAGVDALLAQPLQFFAARGTPEPASLSALSDKLRQAKRPMLWLGPRAPHASLPPESLDSFQRAGWVVLAEVTSQARHEGSPAFSAVDKLATAFVEHARAAEPALREASLPDLILQVGAPLTSGHAEQLLTEARSASLCVVHSNDWPDASNRAGFVLQANEGDVLLALAALLEPVASSWQQLTNKLLAIAEQATSESLADAAREGANKNSFNEFEAFQVLSKYLSASNHLVLGNSLPVRVADEMLARCNAPCVSQRGLNGIDGLLSLGAGVASLAPGRTLLVVGDITALHDLSGLDGVSRCNPNLTILILNNQGGRIFECLPVGAMATNLPAHAAALEDIDAWTTPHAADFCAAFRALGIPSYSAQSAAELDALLLQASKAQGTLMLEARVASGAARRYFTSAKQRINHAVRKDS